MYEFESLLKQAIITFYLERAGFGTIRHTLPPGMSLSVPIFPLPILLASDLLVSAQIA
jgi:hypothetical protein